MKSHELENLYHLFIQEHRLRSEDALVGAGGAMLVMGLREETSDIDLSVPDWFFNYYKELQGTTSSVYSPVDRLPSEVLNNPAYPLFDLHLLHDDEKGVIIKGVNCYTLEYNLAFKQALNRPKDQEDIKILQAAIDKSSKEIVRYCRSSEKLVR